MVVPLLKEGLRGVTRLLDRYVLLNYVEEDAVVGEVVLVNSGRLLRLKGSYDGLELAVNRA